MKNKLKLIFLILTITFLIITVTFFVMNRIAHKKNYSTIFVDMELAGAEDMCARIDVSFLSGKFATSKEGYSFYFAGDSENLFIFSTKDKLCTELENIKKYSYSMIDEKQEPYRVYGVSKEIPEEIKSIALEAYNKMFEQNKITAISFSDYVGDYYLEEDTSFFDYNEKLYLIIFIISAIFLVSFLIMLVIYTFKV